MNISDAVVCWLLVIFVLSVTIGEIKVWHDNKNKKD